MVTGKLLMCHFARLFSRKAAIKETPSRLKAMQETVLRMNEKNVRLQAENKSLKQDLDKLMTEMGMSKERQGDSHFLSVYTCLSSCLSVCVRLSLSLCLSISLSAHALVSLPPSVCVCLSVYLSVSLSCLPYGMIFSMETPTGQ